MWEAWRAFSTAMVDNMDAKTASGSADRVELAGDEAPMLEGRGIAAQQAGRDRTDLAGSEARFAGERKIVQRDLGEAAILAEDDPIDPSDRAAAAFDLFLAGGGPALGVDRVANLSRPVPGGF